jgi:hypothetical protein
MMATMTTTPTSATERIRRQLHRLAHIRGLGPVPDCYARWIDQTRHLLLSSFGEGSQEANDFSRAVGEKASGFGLPLHGDWGIWARLERGEAVLRQILDRLEA